MHDNTVTSVQCKHDETKADRLDRPWCTPWNLTITTIPDNNITKSANHSTDVVVVVVVGGAGRGGDNEEKDYRSFYRQEEVNLDVGMS